MSECVVRMEMPHGCRECFDTHRCFGTGEWHADGTIWCGLAKGYIGDERTKCPVIELPEGHGRLGDLDALIELMLERKQPLVGADNSKDRYRYMQWLADFNAIRDAKTIVPAERNE